MRTTDQKNLTEQTDTEVENELDWSLSEGPVAYKAYHEMADQPLVETDALTQLETNVQLLEDLNSRLAFLMREVRYLIKA